MVTTGMGDLCVKLGSTLIRDTYAEAFGMRYTRLLITAHDDHWLDAALREFCGYSSSVIACDCEAGIERTLSKDESPDGRTAAAVLAFSFSTETLGQALANRTGQCVMTCASTAAFNGLADAEEYLPLGKHIRFFGDGYQKSKMIGGRRFWRIPVMDGEFIIEERAGVKKGIAGGNIIIEAVDLSAALEAARSAVSTLEDLPEVMTPFPGGVVRSGSKVGSRYKALKASTSDAFCPTLKGRVKSELHPDANCALEIVINGTNQESVARAMGLAVASAAKEGIVAISAGNYGGKLGKYHFRLRDLPM